MKNQSGVSLITLVITIIVVIILAAIALGGGALDTAGQAQFAGFTTEMGALQDSFKQAMITVKGNEIGRGHNVSDQQIINYLARGANEFPSGDTSYGDVITPDESGDAKWLTRLQASTIPCTPINRDYATKYLDMKVRKVETQQGSNQIVSYFVTPKGNVFCWPPYPYNGKSYVTNEITCLDTLNNSGEYAETEATDPEAKPVIYFPNGEYVFVSNDAADAADLMTFTVSTDTVTNTSTTPAVVYTARVIDEGVGSSHTGGTSKGITFANYKNNE